MNEIYHRYNVQQQPFIYLNIVTARSDVDVNLTPDKRQLLINNERILLLALKKSLLDTFGQTPSTFQMQNTTIVSMFEPKTVKKEEKVEEANESSNIFQEEEDDNLVPISSTQRFMDVLTQWRRTGDTQGTAPKTSIKRRCTEAEELASRNKKMQKIQDFLTQEPPKEQNLTPKPECEEESVYGDEETSKDTKEQSKLNDSFLNLKELEKESEGETKKI